MAAPPLVYGRFKAPDAPAGTLDVFEAGSLQNRKTTYSNSGLSTQNANPVVLDSLGEADVFYTGLARLVLKKANGSQVWDEDNIGHAADTATEWVNTLSATYASSTTFTLSGDQTTEYHVNRRVKLTGSATAYGRITATSYSAPNTTVTVVLSSGTLDATLASVATSVISANSASGVHFSHIQGSDVASAATLVLNTLIGDYAFITGTTAITAVTLTKGRHVFCKAGGAFTITHGASLICPGASNIAATSGDTFTLIGEASGVVRVADYSFNSVQIGNLGLKGYITGFVPTLGADTDHDLSFSAGACRNSSDTISCKTTAAIVKQIDAAFAEGTNQGGMATGAVANSTAYYYNLIRKNADTTVFDICIDVSASNANTPSGWTFMREIHREFTDGSANLQSQTYKEISGGGIRCKLNTQLLSFADNNPGTDLVTKTIACPPSVEIMGTLYLSDLSAASQTEILFTEVGSTASEPALSTGPASLINNIGTEGVGCTELTRYVDASRNIEYELDQSTADHNVHFYLFSWTNHRRT